MQIVLPRGPDTPSARKKDLPYRTWSLTRANNTSWLAPRNTSSRICRRTCRFDVIAIDNSPANPRSSACIKTPLAPQCRIPQEILRNAFSPPPDAVQSEPGGRFPCLNL